MIEAAIAMPLLMLLIIGSIETGLLVRTYSSTDNGVRAGGRMGSVAGSDSNADQLILARMANETSGLDRNVIDYIIIWNAGGPDGTVPAGCVSAASAPGPNQTSVGVSDGGTDAVGACNVYINPQATNGAFARATGANPTTYFGCTGGNHATRLDCRWPPANRKTQVSPRVLPTGTPESARLRPDYIGIYVHVTHVTATELILRRQSITDYSINLLEPSTFGVGT